MKRWGLVAAVAVVLVAGAIWTLSADPAPRIVSGDRAVPNRLRQDAVDYFIDQIDLDGGPRGHAPDIVNEPKVLGPKVLGEAATTFRDWRVLEPHNFASAEVKLTEENQLKPVYAAFVTYRVRPGAGFVHYDPENPPKYLTRIVFDGSGDLLSVNGVQVGRRSPAFGKYFDRPPPGSITPDGSS
jgi:hypothetical protein